jgi:GAF domain-containing protein
MMSTATRAELEAQVKRLDRSLERAKAKIAALERANAKVTTLRKAVVEGRAREKATAEILRAISSSPTDIRPVFDGIAAAALRLIGGLSSAVISLEGDMLHLAAFTSINEASDEMLKGRFPRPLTQATGGASWAIRSRAPYCVSDTERLPNTHARTNARARGYRSSLAVPLLCDNVAVGAINVTRRDPGTFSKQQIQLFQTFAAQAVIAIENVRLFKELQARNAEVTEALEQQTATAEILRVISSSPTNLQPVFDAILEKATQLCDSHLGMLGLFDGEFHQFVAVRTGNPDVEKWALSRGPFRPHPEGHLLQVLRDGKPHQADLRETAEYRNRRPMTTHWVEQVGVRTFITVPMLKEGRTIGNIGIFRPEVRPFTQKEIDLVSTFANQAVIAIENVRLFNEIQEKSHQLEIANRHKSEFLANMSHELRTPLNAVIGFSEVLHQGMVGELNEKQSEYVNYIHASGSHLLSLINDILDLSKVEAGRMELDVTHFSVPMAIDNALTLIKERATRHGLTLDSALDPSVAEIDADERKFKQVMLNLLSNAVKFTPEGGQDHGRCASCRRHAGSQRERYRHRHCAGGLPSSVRGIPSGRHTRGSKGARHGPRSCADQTIHRAARRQGLAHQRAR